MTDDGFDLFSQLSKRLVVFPDLEVRIVTKSSMTGSVSPSVIGGLAHAPVNKRQTQLIANIQCDLGLRIRYLDIR